MANWPPRAQQESNQRKGRSAVTLIQVRSSSRETKHNPAVYAAGLVYDEQLLRALTCLPILVVSPTEIARKSDSGT